VKGTFAPLVAAGAVVDTTGTGQRRWSMRWKLALNAFDMAFDGRLSASRR
jgi:putative transposase